MESRKVLLVEGEGDLRVITALAGKHGIDLSKSTGSYPVPARIKSMPTLLDPEFLATETSGSGLEILGIVLDADTEPGRRMESLRQSCEKGLRRQLPEALPVDGLILDAEEGKPRFGVWIMPDNSSQGMLETFLAYLVPQSGSPCWEWTAELCDQARDKGATFREVHRDKARIHAYLAFQDEPGRQLHEAVIKRILDPNHPMAKRFLDWFCRLFELTPAQNTSGMAGE